MNKTSTTKNGECIPTECYELQERIGIISDSEKTGYSDVNTAIFDTCGTCQKRNGKPSYQILQELRGA